MDNDWGITLIGKGRYQVRVKRTEKRTGRQVNRREMVTGSKQDARAVRERLCAEFESTAAARPRTRLSAFADAWHAERVGRLKATTTRRYGYSLEHILPALGDVYLDALTPADVAGYVASRTAAGAEGNTVLNELKTLRTMAADAVAEGYCQRDWAARVAAPQVSRYTDAEPNLLTGPQFVALLEHVPAKWRGFVLLIATTGLRWGEASALRWSDIADGQARITRTNDRGVESTPKTEGSIRTVPVMAEVLALLPRSKRSALLCPNRLGRLHTGYPLVRILKAACLVAKVPRVTVHGLRRTLNNLMRQHADRDVLKSITGHTTDRMVEHYSMISAGEKFAAARTVATLLGVSESVLEVSRSKER